MAQLWLIIGIALGALGVWLILRARLGELTQTRNACTAAEREIASLSATLDHERAASAEKLERKNCRTRNAAPSNQPHPTRNAYVPAPPASPVVSRSRKTRRRGVSEVASGHADPRPSSRRNRSQTPVAGGSASSTDRRP